MSRRGWFLFAAMCVIWGIPYLLIKVAVQELAPSTMVLARTGLAVLALALICTGLAFLVFFQLITEVGPARATVITYINPAVAVLLGVLVLDERFTVVTGVGFVLVLAGAVLATARSVGPAGSDTPAEPAPVPSSC